MISLKFAIFKFCVLLISVGMIYGSTQNTCGNLGTASPQLPAECTGVSYKNGTCCYVENSANNVRYCVLLLGTAREEAINNFESAVNIPSISVNCHSEFLALSFFLIIGLLI